MDKVVDDATLQDAKNAAKKELEEYADEVKKKIDDLTYTTPDEKDAAKAAVDQALADALVAVDAAIDTDGVDTAVADGKQAMDDIYNALVEAEANIINLDGGTLTLAPDEEVEFDEPNDVDGYTARWIAKAPEHGKAWLASVHYAAQGSDLGAYPFEVLYTMDDGAKYLVHYTPVVQEEATEVASTTTVLSRTGSSVKAVAILALLLLVVGTGLAAATRKVRY